MRAAHFGGHDHHAGVAQEPPVRRPEAVAGEDHACVAARPQALLVRLGVGGVADHGEPQVGAQAAEGVHEHVGVVLGHEPPHEEHVAARLEPEL